MDCPNCHIPMVPEGDRFYCSQCPRFALRGDSAEDIEEHEIERRLALSLLNNALAPRDRQAMEDKAFTDAMEAMMGQTIQTRGCPNCGGTMYKTVDTDENGNPTNESQFICNACGHMA